MPHRSRGLERPERVAERLDLGVHDSFLGRVAARRRFLEPLAESLLELRLWGRFLSRVPLGHDLEQHPGPRPFGHLEGGGELTSVDQRPNRSLVDPPLRFGDAEPQVPHCQAPSPRFQQVDALKEEPGRVGPSLQFGHAAQQRQDIELGIGSAQGIGHRPGHGHQPAGRNPVFSADRQPDLGRKNPEPFEREPAPNRRLERPRERCRGRISAALGHRDQAEVGQGDDPVDRG